MSEQTFPQLIMTILIRKEKNKTEEIILRLPHERFRMTAGTPEGKKFKSHELGLNPRWGLLKLDSGKYN